MPTLANFARDALRLRKTTLNHVNAIASANVFRSKLRHMRNIRLLFARYALALGATVIALVATLVLRRDGPTPSFLFFVPAVAISAWYGGVGPRLLVSVLSVLPVH